MPTTRRRVRTKQRPMPRPTAQTKQAKGEHQGRACSSAAPVPRLRVAKGKRVAEGMPTTPSSKRRACKSIFRSDQPMSDTARADMQQTLKICSTSLLGAAQNLPRGTTCLDAVRLLAPVASVDSDLVCFTVAEHLTDKSREHTKHIAHVQVAREKGNDVFRVLNADKKSVAIVSNWTHGSKNVELSSRILLLCFAVGFQQAELHCVKTALQQLVSDQ